MPIHSGMMCADGKINANDSGIIGISILKMLDGGNFTTTLPTKLKCKSLADLQKKVKINKKDTTLKPLLLFTRLALVSQRALTLCESLQYELTPLPMSLFDEKQFLRKADKSKLGAVLKGKVEPVERPQCVSTVVDGGWLLYQKAWGKDDTFKQIADSYVDFIKVRSVTPSRTTVVFDGYSSSPKDHEHRRRLGTAAGCAEIKILPEKCCPVTRTKFLSNTRKEEINQGSLIFSANLLKMFI